MQGCCGRCETHKGNRSDENWMWRAERLLPSQRHTDLRPPANAPWQSAPRLHQRRQAASCSLANATQWPVLHKFWPAHERPTRAASPRRLANSIRLRSLRPTTPGNVGEPVRAVGASKLLLGGRTAGWLVRSLGSLFRPARNVSQGGGGGFGTELLVGRSHWPLATPLVRAARK